MASAQVLVLGGTAMLGAEIAAEAIARGHAVTCVARGGVGEVPEGAEFIRADRDDDDALARAATRTWDAVFDVSRMPGHVRRATRDLVSAGVYVFVSTCSVYARQDEPGADESAQLLEPLMSDTEELADAYGRRKVACEQLVTAAFGASRSLIARAGLIGGPRDATTRSGYWPMRFAASDAVVVPSDDALPTQLIDVRDLAAWLVDAVGDGSIRGIANTLGDRLPLAEHLDIARRVAGHRGAVLPVSGEWLAEHGVAEFDGPKSMPLWLADAEWRGFMDRSNDRAKRLGLRLRPLADTLDASLAWERELGFDRPRRAGLTAAENDELVARLAAGA